MLRKGDILSLIVAIAATILMVFCCHGCATTVKTESAIIGEMDCLLAKPCPNDPRWCVDRDTARKDAEPFIKVSPSPTPGGQ